MYLKYELTLDDYWEYYRSLSKYNFSRLWVRWTRRLIIGGSIIYGIGCILYAIAHYDYYSDKFAELLTLILISCFCVAGGIVLLFVFNAEFLARSRYNGLKKSLQKKPSLIAERNISVYKNGLDFKAKTFDIFLDWELFNYFSETDILFLLYFRDKEFQLIPKRCFDNSEAIEQFRELLQNKAKNSDNLDNNLLSTEKIAEQDSILKLEYQLEAQDYLAAKQARNFATKWIVWYYAILIVVISGLGFYNLYKGIYRPDLLGSNETSGDAISNGFLISGCIFYLLLDQYPKINIFQRKKIVKKWDNNPEMQASRKLIVTEHEIVLMTDYFQESIDPEEYLKSIENKQLFLLYYSQDYYQIIPKKAFNSEDEMKQFREAIAGHDRTIEVSF